MLHNIKDHSCVVGKIAEFIGQALFRHGENIDVNLVLAGALLHDIGKTECLHTDRNHALVGRDICLKHGFVDIAPLVEEHVIISLGFPDQNISEKEIVYYADKRVNHDQIVSLDDRLLYILDKYGKSNSARLQAIKKNFNRCFFIEEKLFTYLEFSPEELGLEMESYEPTWLKEHTILFKTGAASD